MPHTVTITGTAKHVVLPNGLRLQGGSTITISDQDYSLLSSTFKASFLTSDVASSDYSRLSLLGAPTGAKAENVSRMTGITNVGPPASGTIIASLFPMPGGLVVNNIGIMLGSAGSVVTHAWVGLADANLVVRAVSADSPGLGAWTSGFTSVVLPVTAAYTVPATANYYAFFCMAATTVPQLAGFGEVSTPAGIAPVVAATSSTGQTTPPSVGGSIGALSGSSASHFYAWTT